MLGEVGLGEVEIAPLDAALESLFAFDLESLSGGDERQVLAAIITAEQISRRLSAIQVAAASEVADQSRYELGSAGLSARHGQPRPGPFLEQILRISGAETHRRIALGSSLRRTRALTGELLEPRYPVLAEAFTAGDVGPESAAVIVRALDDARRVAALEDLEVAERGLVDHARDARVQFVADLAAVVRDRLDQDGVLPREQQTKLRRSIRLGRERNGIVPISGALEPTTAALLKSIFDEANAPGATPRFLSDEERREATETTTAADGTQIVKVRDLRTRDQRQHDVLAGIITSGLRNTGLEAGQLRSHAEVVVHVSAADIEAGIGTGSIDGISEPVSMNTVQRILCDATFRKAILGNEGEVLALGKAQYPFTSAQRKAAVARDGDRCLLCDVPATWADAHHVQPFNASGGLGRTDVDNLVLLCGPHHDLIHHSQWRIRMFEGVPHVLAPPEIDPGGSWKRLGKSRVPLERAS